MGRQIIPAKFWADPVATPGDLPTFGVPKNQARLVSNDGDGFGAIYYWDGANWIKIADPNSMAGRLKTGVHLTGPIDGLNTVFTAPDLFVHDGTSNEMVYLRGLRLREGVGNDYVASESGGVGSGYDTITLARPPRVNDVLLVDYYVDA